MTPELAWVLGFIASDGHIARPTYRKKGNEDHIGFCIHHKDAEVLHKVKAILGCNGNVRLYPNYKSPSAVLAIHSRRDIIEEYGHIIKKEVPLNITGYERHYMRGLFDGDGCLHYRVNRRTMRINIISQAEAIVNWVATTLHEKLGIPLKKARWKHQDNLFIAEWEGKIARLIAWYMYHGNIKTHVLERKYQYYRRYVLKDITDKVYNHTDELLKAVCVEWRGSNLSMRTIAPASLKWCHIIQGLLLYNSVPVPVNKGKTKYYELYLPMANTQDASQESRK